MSTNWSSSTIWNGCFHCYNQTILAFGSLVILAEGQIACTRKIWELMIMRSWYVVLTITPQCCVVGCWCWWRWWWWCCYFENLLFLMQRNFHGSCILYAQVVPWRTAILWPWSEQSGEFVLYMNLAINIFFATFMGALALVITMKGFRAYHQYR